MQISTVLFTAFMAIGASAQLFPPPPNCGDTNAFLQCSAVNSIACANPLGLGSCYAACEGCCQEPDNPEACAMNGI